MSVYLKRILNFRTLKIVLLVYIEPLVMYIACYNIFMLGCAVLPTSLYKENQKIRFYYRSEQ